MLLNLIKGRIFTSVDIMNLRVYVIVIFIFNDKIQCVSRLEDINAGGDFLGLCDQKSSYKHVSDFGR
jgi:hypothetical protein